MDPAPSFPANRLAAIGDAEEVEIETRAAPDAPSHRAIIWVVVESGEVFVRSVRGPRGRWYREVTANPVAALWVAGVAIAVRATPATDDGVERCSRALQRKYGRDPALRTMFRPDTLPTTLKLTPR